MKSVLPILALSLFLAADISSARVPRVTTEALTGCEDCDHGNGLPYIEAKAGIGGQFPLPKCRGIRNDRFGLGAFGAKRRHGRHTGVDWNAPIGTPTTSPWAGTVTFVGSAGKAAGYTVKVKHENGYETVYMHLGKNFSVKKGQKVKAGQKLALTSNSGNAKGTNPHLHFEVRNKKGQRVNPTSIFGCNNKG